MMKKIFTVLGLLILSIQGFSQQGALLYNMEKIPQVNSVKPSFMPENKVWVQIFSVSPTFYSPLSFSDVIENRNGEKWFVGTDRFLDALGNTNRLQFALDANYFSFGFRVSDWMFSLNNTTHMIGNIELEKDFFGIILKGNVPYEGQTVNLIEKDFGEAIAYQEIAFGAARKLNDQWTVGGKFKVLLGALHITTGESTLSLTTSEGFNNITAKANISGRMSSMFKFDSTDFENAEAGAPSNVGLGLDLGATFKLDDKFEFSGSLLDIGYIRWSQNVKSIMNKGTGSFSFNGLDIPTMIESKEWNIAFKDSLDKAIDIDFQERGNSYTTSLPFKFFLSGSYRILPELKASLMYRGEFFSSHYYSSTTLDVNYTLGNWFEVAVGNSFVSSSFWNPGVALNFTIANTFQIFFAANYMSSFYATNLRTFSGMFGMNLTFGKAKDK